VRARLWRLGVAGSVVSAAIGAGTLSATPALAATTYVVDNTVAACSDGGPGTAAQPFCTIAKGAQKAQAGDTVLVNDGTYTGTSVNPSVSGTSGSPITFTANAGVTVSGGTGGFAVTKSYIVVNGFTVTGTSSYGISVSGGSNDVISHNTVSYAGHPVQGQNAAGIYVSNANGGTISGNISHDNSAHGIILTGSTTGVTVQGNVSYHNAYQWQRNANGIDDVAPGNSIIGNVTYANEDSGINMYTGGNNALVADNITYDNGDHGIDDFNVTGGRIIGNTVYYNCTSGINVEGTSGNYLVENNISVNNATDALINPTPMTPPLTNDCKRRHGNIGIWDSAPASTTLNNNLVWQSNGSSPEYMWAGTVYNSQQALTQATGQEANGIVADPLFANPGGWDFHLTAGSPAIDSADSGASGEQSADGVGNARVDDPATQNAGIGPRAYDDRGALEFQPPGSLTGPTAHLTVSTGGTGALAVTADASGSTAGSVPITSYTFDFGDGTTLGPQPDAVASHTYTSAGTYTVSVTVTDGNGLTSSTTQQVTLNLPPTARLSVSPASGSTPLPVTADASASTAGNSPITGYTFNFGDGTTVGPQPGATASHTYTSSGIFTVTVTVTDANGLTSSANQTVAVTGTAPARYINQIASNSSATTHTSGFGTVWRTGGVAAGDMIVAVVQLTGTSPTGTVSGTDSAGDTLNVASDIADGSGDRLVTLYGIARNGLNVNDTITVSFPSATSYRLTADEAAGVISLDKQSAAGGTTSSFSSGSTGTTSRPGELVFAATATFGGTSVSWSTGWTGLTTYTLGSNALARAYQIPAGTGSFAGTGTASAPWLAEVVTFS